MNKEVINFETKEKGEWFGLLDVIKIDGRWAQVVGYLVPRSSAEGQAVHFLDDDTYEKIEFSDYEMSKFYGQTAGDLLEKDELSAAAFARIIWDAQNVGTELAKQVKFFGVFKKKE